MASGVRTLSSLHDGQHNRTDSNDDLGHAPNQMSLHFLDLPVDILALILTPLLIQDGPIPLCPCGSTGSSDKDGDGDDSISISINPVPILLIHPAIYAIATPLFYEGNVFVLDLRLKHGLHARSYLDEQAEEDALDRREGFNYDDVVIRRRREALALEGSLRRIRSLQIKILKLRGWIDARIVPLVRDMIVRGNLAELTVEMYSSGGHAAGGTRAQAARESSIFTRPPLAGVLSLLSDPYLRTARLWVSATAGGAWEPFRTATASADLVQIDWASIVKQLDPEGRQVAVLRDGGKANVAR